ncbi:MAG: 2,3-diketo-L-gulonate-binding periplasmic protein YiaO precursor [Synergistetes bacterium ADurb.Bin155]|nr:DctP family TRAP transporter solute-binding subunit [Synergistales bacterium]MBP8996543.1 DctP family TRAP transporter solute-binding subunit [Synergistales bacterium]OQB44728.1 MAG: 2,3-diketo-L-gulonate-binding periplasmic protein YiaO precursor [Synergistetes bacterium ADurb.Bin155]
MKRDRFFGMILALVLSSVLAFPVFGAEFTIKVGTIVSETHPDYIVMNSVFKPLVETNSKGRIAVELFPNGQLGDDREMTEAVQLGSIEICIPATGALASFDKRVQVLDLPYLFVNEEQAFKALDGELGKKINSQLPELGFVNLGYPHNGFRHVTSNVKPIYKPEDLKGLKIRTMEIPAHIDFFRSVGANPTPMSSGELYAALMQGTVDAQERPVEMIYDGKFYEVQKYVSKTRHCYSATVVLASKAFLDKLPEDLREVVESAARVFVLGQRDMIMGLEEERFKALEAKGMQINEVSPEQMVAFQRAADPLYDKYEDVIGKEIMDIVREIRK